MGALRCEQTIAYACDACGVRVCRSHIRPVFGTTADTCEACADAFLDGHLPGLPGATAAQDERGGDRTTPPTAHGEPDADATMRPRLTLGALLAIWRWLAGGRRGRE